MVCEAGLDRKERNLTMGIGIISFTDPRQTRSEREAYVRQRHASLRDRLIAEGVEILDPMTQIRRPTEEPFGICSLEDTVMAVRALLTAELDGVILGLWDWTNPHLAVYVSKATNLPILLYTEASPAHRGIALMNAVGKALRESAPNRFALSHQRVTDDLGGTLKWCRATSACARMNRSSVLLWGAPAGEDDTAPLRGFLIGDILSEGENSLLRRAERLLSTNPGRVDALLAWLESSGVKICYDRARLTPETLRTQLALYLSAKERLKELDPARVVGASVRCQGAVAQCFLPALLPFPQDSEGEQTIVPATCGCDVKGLLTCVMLNMLEPQVPPFYGKLRLASDGLLVLTNCGGASIYYSALSLETSAVLPRVSIVPQREGVRGGAVAYESVAGTATLARLIRVAGRYYCQFGVGESIEPPEGIKESVLSAECSPIITVKLEADTQKLLRAIGPNHISASAGDLCEEITLFCRLAGVEPIRIDSDGSLDEFSELFSSA